MILRYILFFLFLVFLYLPSQAAMYPLNSDVIGILTQYTVRESDTLYGIARQHDIGIVELLAANPGVDPWRPTPGKELILPTSHVVPVIEHKAIVLNLSELRLFYFPDAQNVMTFPIGIGKEGWQTPLGTTFITLKRKNPIWIPPASIRKENPELPAFIAAGEDNPLGLYAMNLGWKDYRIHGTNRPYGVGKRSSHGCIRLYPEDIEILFSMVTEGTKVIIIDKPYKLGWQSDALYLEITPTQNQADIIAAYKQPDALNLPEVYEAVRKIAGNNTKISWYAIEEAIRQHNGIPVIIGYKTSK